ncbi:MAG: dihydroorotase [Alphaproteobacteria bacterium]|nr:dihydroorotase [Alphaproteobacteria bacterium]
MNGTRQAIVGARLLDPASGLDAVGTLLIEDGRIADFGPRLFADGVPSGIEVHDAAGLALAPGLIDMHAFLGEPGREHKETLVTAGEAAAAGGVTTIVATPNTDPVIDDVALVEFVQRRADETCPVRVRQMAALTRGLKGQEMTEIGLLRAAGAVAFTDGDRAVAEARLMRRALAYASTFDAILVQVPEEPSLARDGVMNEGEMSMRLGLSGIPAMAETIMVERDLRLVELTGGRLHFSHVSTATAVAALGAARARGLRVSAGAAPHSFALNETAIGEYRTYCKVSPPLRAEADRLALVAGIADGTIDVISSGHRPQDQESKRLPFAQASFGIIGLQTMLPLALELHHNGSVPLLRLLACMTSRPAGLLGLEAGRLLVGRPADLVLIDLDRPWIISEREFRSKTKNSPFDGRPVQGRVMRTLVGGQIAYDRKRDG